MTASQVYSNNLDNIVANPTVTLSNKELSIKALIDTQPLATTSVDEIDDSFLFGPIPSNAVILNVEFLNDVLDSDGVLAGNVGLYYTGIGGSQNQRGVGTGANVKSLGDLIDADCIASATSVLGAANTAPASVRFEAADINNIGQQAWQIAGLSVDPGGLFAVGFKVTTAATTAVAGDVTCIITYAID